MRIIRPPLPVISIVFAACTLGAAWAEDLERPVNSLRDMFAALRVCLLTVPLDSARTAADVTVRLSFKSNGEIFGEPFIVIRTPGLSTEARQTYQAAIAQALRRCPPLPFSNAWGAGTAGRPVVFRFRLLPHRTQEM
jgi:hypothetical protein